MKTHPHPHRLCRVPLGAGLVLAGLYAAARAQEPPQPPTLDLQLHLAQAEFERQVFIGEGAEFMAAGMGTERVIKGAPYCADAVHETVQWLADGNGGAPNRITQSTSTRLCRDGEGRTRQEFERNGRKVVYLRDPLSHESWVLDVERKTAQRLGDGRGSFDNAAWRDYAQRMRDWARGNADRARAGAPPGGGPAQPTPPALPMAPTPPTPVVINPGDSGPGGQRHVEVNVVRLRKGGEGAEGAPAMEWSAPPAAVQWRAQVLAPRGAGSVMPLPGKDIEGVRANGERTTWVIEAGKVGNEKPIQLTREVWTAPELMVTLSSRDFDPRSGEVNYRLKNLKKGEPDAALMRVPAEFTKPVRPAPRASSGPTG